MLPDLGSTPTCEKSAHRLIAGQPCSHLRLVAVCCILLGLAFSSAPIHAQDRREPGKSIGTVTTHGNLIVLTLDQDALNKPHFFDLEHRTIRFTPDGTRYRIENLPLQWDADFGPAMPDSHGTLKNFAFPFSGKTWNEFSVGVTGSMTFGEPIAGAARGPRTGMPPNRGGGLSVERYALLQQVGSTIINTVPAISVFFKPRMTGTRYVKELNDRAVVTWSLSEPYAGIQDWTWTPTVNRFQAVLHKDGTIDLSYDKLSARDGVVGVFPIVTQGSEKQIGSFPAGETPGVAPDQDIRSVKLAAVDGLFLKATIETRGPLPAEGEPRVAELSYRLCLSAEKPDGPCTRDARQGVVWSVQGGRDFRGGSRRANASRGPRYFALGPGLSPQVTVEGNTVSVKGVLPVGFKAGGSIWVSAASETPGTPGMPGTPGTAPAPGSHVEPHRLTLAGIASPELDFASIKRQDGAFPLAYESFYYPEAPRPNDLTCSVINALGDRFDLLAYYSDFRVDNPEAGTPSTGPLGGGPDGGQVTGIGANQRNLASYCTKGRFQWQFVQPVDADANQMDEYPPAGAMNDDPHDVLVYTHQLAERTFNGKVPPYDYAMSQIGHEMGHRWSAFVSAKVGNEVIVLGPTHWDVGLQAPVPFPYQRPTEASAMGGGVWQDNFDGTFTQLDDNYYVPATGYSYLDLYLMGLIAPSEVPDFFILRNLERVGKDANGHPIYKADRTKITIDQVIAQEGPRLPDVDHAQKRFNTGMVVVVEHGKQPSQKLLDSTEGIRLRWMDYWETTTGHRSVMTTDPK